MVLIVYAFIPSRFLNSLGYPDRREKVSMICLSLHFVLIAPVNLGLTENLPLMSGQK